VRDSCARIGWGKEFSLTPPTVLEGGCKPSEEIRKKYDEKIPVGGRRIY